MKMRMLIPFLSLTAFLPTGTSAYALSYDEARTKCEAWQREIGFRDIWDWSTERAIEYCTMIMGGATAYDQCVFQNEYRDPLGEEMVQGAIEAREGEEPERKPYAAICKPLDIVPDPNGPQTSETKSESVTLGDVSESSTAQAGMPHTMDPAEAIFAEWKCRVPAGMHNNTSYHEYQLPVVYKTVQTRMSYGYWTKDHVWLGVSPTAAMTADKHKRNWKQLGFQAGAGQIAWSYEAWTTAVWVQLEATYCLTREGTVGVELMKPEVGNASKANFTFNLSGMWQVLQQVSSTVEVQPIKDGKFVRYHVTQTFGRLPVTQSGAGIQGTLSPGGIGAGNTDVYSNLILNQFTVDANLIIGADNCYGAWATGGGVQQPPLGGAVVKGVISPPQQPAPDPTSPKMPNQMHVTDCKKSSLIDPTNIPSYKPPQ